MRAPSPRLVSLGILIALATSCRSWERQTPDPKELLRELQRVSVSELVREQNQESGAAPDAPRLDIDHAASFAVQFHPELRALRATIGVQEALIVEAGTLPDLGVGWSAMDVLATQWTGGTPHTENYLSGLGVMWRLPRPDEWPARTGLAEADRDAARAAIVHEEWRLAGAVRRTFVEHAGALAQLELSKSFQETLERSAGWFERASEAGTATALQAELAGLELSKLQQDRLQHEGDVQRTRQQLCALLGLPPSDALELLSGLSLNELEARFALPFGENVATSDLVRQSLDARPDLRELLAQYEAAEQAIRLEVARQWPEVSIGTGIEVLIGIFRGFDNPAIETARARRTLLGERLRAAVHEIRAEIHEARRAEQQAASELRTLDERLLPGIERSIELSGRAFRSGAVSFAEILEAQRQVLEARRRREAARAALVLGRVRLLHALGRESALSSAPAVPTPSR